MQLAKFIVGRPSHSDFLSEKLSRIFSSLDITSLKESSKLAISNTERKRLIDGVIKFYNIHLDRPGKLKSLEVLKEVFS